MIRKAVKEDLPRIAELEAASFKEPWSEEDLRRDMEDNPFSSFLVDEEEETGRLKGFCDFWITFEQAQLVRLAVDPACRRQGIADRLLKASIEDAKNQGAETYTLDVRISNEPAIGLYRQSGFIVIHTQQGYYGCEDGLLMAKGL